MAEYKKYREKRIWEMRPYIKGEDLSKISHSPEFDKPETDMGFIAHNIASPHLEWYVVKKYAEKYYKEVPE